MSDRALLSRRLESVEEVGQWVKSMILREQLRYRAIWVEWLRNIMAFHGESTKFIDENLKILQRLSPAQRKELDYVLVNFVSPHARLLAAKLARARPILTCDPATTDDSDILAAKCGDRLLIGEWYQQNMDFVNQARLMWTCLTGNGYVHQYFDASKGGQVEGESGLYQGQIVSEAINSFKVYTEPHRLHIDACRWAIIRERLPRDEIEEKYGEHYGRRFGKELILPKGTTNQPDDVADAYLEVSGIKGIGVDDSEYVDVDYLYHLPTAWYPKGRYAIAVGTMVIWDGPFPYPFLGRLPILHFREILCPWRMPGETSTSEVLNIQNLYNGLRNIERDYHRDNLSSKWKVHRKTKVRNRALLRSRKPGIIDWEGEKEPSREPGLQIPGGIYQSIELAWRELERSGLSNSTHASPPSGVSSGRAILALQEQDEIAIGLTAFLSEPEYAKAGQNILLMAKEFYVEPRKYKMVGQTNIGGMFSFDRADLRQTTDVRCQSGSAMPLNKLAKREAIKEDLTLGLLGPVGSEEALVRARRMLSDSIPEDIRDDQSLDEYVSDRENMLMSAGNPMPVSEVDNHAIHLKAHLRRAKSPGVRDVPEILAIFVAHKREHEAYLAGGMTGAPPAVPGILPVATPANNSEPPNGGTTAVGIQDLPRRTE
jgi:hypothetical protein